MTCSCKEARLSEIGLLRRIVASMVAEADKAGVRIVTGDTKVVGRGSADKVFVTTSGVGVIPPGRVMAADRIRPNVSPTFSP